MKKVLFALNNMNIGGTEKAFLNYVETLSEDEYDITLLLLEESGGFLPYVPKRVHIQSVREWKIMKTEILDPPLQVAEKYLRSGRIGRAFGIAFFHCLAKLSNDRTEYYRYILRDLRLNEEYDTAIAYCGPFDFITALVLDCITARKKVQWIHFDVSKFKFNTKTCKRLYRKFDEIRVVSDEARYQLIKKIPQLEAKTITSANIVLAEQCRRMAEMGEGFLDKFDGIRIVTVGRLSEEKGQDIIPDIAAELRKSGIHFRWYLVGDGKLRSKIESKCSEYAVEENIVFLGTQANPYPFLKEADLYVQTSVHEGFCITLAEAKAFNLPIISTECAGAHEQLDGREMCFIVNRSIEDMYSSIQEVIDKGLRK